MEAQHAQYIQNIQNISTELVGIEQEILNAFSNAQGFPQADLADVISTENIQTQVTHGVRRGALLTEDRDSRLDLSYDLVRGATDLRRRWSVDLYEKPDQAEQHDPRLSRVHSEARDDDVEKDFILTKHSLDTNELCNAEAVHFENGRVTIHNTSFAKIHQTERLLEWFDDETIDTGIDALHRIFRCEDQDVAIIGTGMAWELYQNGASVTATVPPTEQLQDRVGKKQFIVIPINNGWQRMVEDKVTDGERGSHWTIMVIDCHGPVIHTRHYDSMNHYSSTRNLTAAKVVLRGFSRLYAETRPDYKIDEKTLEASLRREERTPNQKRDNHCKDDSCGACGPFVWAFAKEIVQYIVECR
jgi:hypothetical protein